MGQFYIGVNSLIDRSWSTGEILFAALVVRDGARLDRMGYTTPQAVQRIDWWGGYVESARTFYENSRAGKGA